MEINLYKQHREDIRSGYGTCTYRAESYTIRLFRRRELRKDGLVRQIESISYPEREKRRQSTAVVMAASTDSNEEKGN